MTQNKKQTLAMGEKQADNFISRVLLLRSFNISCMFKGETAWQDMPDCVSKAWRNMQFHF